MLLRCPEDWQVEFALPDTASDALCRIPWIPQVLLAACLRARRVGDNKPDPASDRSLIPHTAMNIHL